MDLGRILDMSSFSFVPIEWQEPRKIDDLLLKVDNWEEYAEIHGAQYIHNYDDTVY